MGSLVFLLTMILFKVTLGQFCIASEFDASPTAFFTTSVTVKVLDSFSSPLSGVTISISSTFISPADSSILSGTSGADGNVVFSIFYTNIGLLTISLNCISFATGTLDVTPVIPALAFGSDTLPSAIGIGFTITASVRNGRGDVETTNAAYTCDLTLLNGVADVTLALGGALSALSSAGVCSYSGLYIVNLGTYTYKVTAISGSITFSLSSSSFAIADKVNHIIASVSTPLLTIYFDFDLTVNIYGYSGNAFLDFATITLATNDGSMIGGYSVVTTNIGFHTFNIYFTTLVSNLRITVNGVSLDYSSFNTWHLNILTSLDAFPTRSTDIFTATITVYNRDITAVETKNYNSGAYPFYLRLYDCVNDNLEGYLYDPVTDKGYQVSDIQGITVSGVATIPNLRVLTSGEFWIYSNLTIDVPQADWYHIFTMAKVIPSYKVTASVTTISTFFNFKITVTLYDEYGNPFTLQPNIVLSMIDKSLGGNISGMVPASGTIDLACFFNTNTSSKDLVITTTSPVSYWTVTLDLTITNSVLVIDIPILPITSTDLFTVTVILKSSDLVETETKNGPYLIVLGLNAIASASGTSITGLLTADSVSGLSTFSSLRINSSGNFTLTAYLAGAEPATSEIFSVTNSVKRIYLESPTTVAPNELFIIRVILYGDDDQFFIQSAIITITTNLTSASSYQVTTTTGEETLVFYQANSGIYSIEASTNVNNVTSSSVFVTVTGLSLVLSTDKTPSTSTDQVTVNIEVHNSDGLALIDDLSLTLSIVCQVFCSGNITSPAVIQGTTSAGILSLGPFAILSSGTFVITVNSENFINGVTNSFTIVNYVKSIVTLGASLSISANLNNVITITLFGDDDKTFMLAGIVAITQISNLSYSLSSSTPGHSSLVYWFTLPGTYTLTLTSQLVNKLIGPITVLKNKIIMSGPTPVPTTSIAVFTLEVKVTLNDGLTVENLHGPYTIELTPSPSSGILSVFSLTTTNGVASINTVMTTEGTYTITVSTPNMDSLVTSSFTITDGLSNMIVADSLLSQYKKYLIVLPVTLVNNHALPYLHSTNLTIACSGVTALSNSISTSNATASFYMYFNTTGSKSCTIEGVGTTDPSVAITKSFTMAITDAISADHECNIALTSTTCFTCIVNANLNLLNSCDCSPNSVYNSNTNKCQCYDTYTETNNYCALCGNYFSSSELEASYAADYKSFSIIFARPVSVKTKASCVNSVTLPEFLSSLSPTCIWESFTKLTYTFENPVKDDTLKVIVDPKLVQTEGSTCNYDIKDLYISISTPYPMPTPVAKIVAPSLVSLSCSTEDVVISASSSSISNDYNYAWTAKISPANSALLTVIESVISTSFKIPNSMLSASKITLTLKVTNKIFETSSSASTSILVTTAAALGVSFNLGSSASIKESNFISIEAKVSEPCGTLGPYSYDWSYTSDLSAPVFNISDLLATSTKANSFLTKPGFMFAGHTYVFSVGVSSINITGTAVLALKIEHRPLVLKFDRASGTVGVDRDLAITLTASDPDNPDASIVIAWDCISNSAVCKNSDGKQLVDRVKTPTVIIPASKLMEDAYYSFTVTASTSSKKASTSVDIKIDKSLKGDLKLHSNDKVITSHKKLVIKPEIDPNEDPIFRWEINPVPDSDVPIKFDDPYLVVSEGYLKSGKTYSLTFSMKSPKGGTLSTYTSFSVNSEPLCNNFTAELNLENRWVLTGEGCGDIENSDLIVFQYGVEFETNKRWISLPMYSNSIKTRLSKDAKSVMLKVCNSYHSCSTFYANITSNKTGRMLNVLSDFEEDIENPDLIPSSIIYYAELIEDQETFGFIYETMQEYFYSQLIDDLTVNVFLDCLDLLLQNKTFVIEGNYSTNATNLANYVMKEYSENLLDSQVGSLLNTLGAYVEYIDRESLNSLLNTIGALWIGENSIYTYLGHIGDITLLRSRLSSENLQGLEINLNTSIIALPSDLPVTPDLIYDIQYSKYRAENDYIEFTFFTAGTYKSYTVVLEIPEEIEIIPITPIQISMEGIYDSGKHYECKVLINSTWEDGGCAVNSTTDTEAIIDIYHESVYVLRKNDNSCKMGRGPIAVMSILIFLTILLVIIFTIVDKKFEDVPSTRFVLLLHYPLTSICIKQQRPRRSIFALQLCTCGLLLLALIGVFHNLFDSATQDHEASFNDFYERQLSRGAAGWVLIQVFTIPIFLLNSLTDSLNKYHYLTIPASIVISVISSITVVIMTTQHCAGYTNYWIANFLIFLLIDSATLQVIYSLIIFKFFIKIEVKPKEHMGGEKISEYSRPGDNANKGINYRI